jgi:mannose-6-phosphate isomerase-like protein (cupin superfamily)
LEKQLLIPDVYLKKIDLPEDGILLDEADHLLRRFGRCQVVFLDGADTERKFIREQADEYWAILKGEAVMELQDTREDSPSSGKGLTLELNANQSVGVLVPFGVSCRLTGSATFVRITTHSPGDLLEAG